MINATVGTISEVPFCSEAYQDIATSTLWKGLSERPEPPEFRLLPQRAGFRLAKKLVVFDVAPANRVLAELVPLAPVGVDRPELPSDVAKKQQSRNSTFNFTHHTNSASLYDAYTAPLYT